MTVGHSIKSLGRTAGVMYSGGRVTEARLLAPAPYRYQRYSVQLSRFALSRTDWGVRNSLPNGRSAARGQVREVPNPALEGPSRYVRFTF